MTCRCEDCRPQPKCRTPHCGGTPAFNERGYCRECADMRADYAHDAAKDAKLERAEDWSWDY